MFAQKSQKTEKIVPQVFHMGLLYVVCGLPFTRAKFMYYLRDVVDSFGRIKQLFIQNIYYVL